MAHNATTAALGVAEACRLFGVDAEILGRVMAKGLERGGDFCELYFQFRHRTNLYLHDRLIRSGNAEVLRGVGVRVLKGDQTGFSHTAVLDEASLMRAAGIAAMIAGGSSPGPLVKPGTVAGPAWEPQYPRGDREADLAGARKWLESLEHRMRTLDRRVEEADCGANLVREQVLIVNSEGLMVCDDRPRTGFWTNCVARERDRKESNGASSGRMQVQAKVMTPALRDQLARDAVDRTVRLFEAVEAPGGEMPLVLAAGEGGILVHEAMGHGFEADFIRMGSSIFAGRMGEMCAPPSVSIIDTGVRREDWGALSVDDEGCPGQETLLVDRGRLHSWIHDRLGARHFGCAPTGNGRRQDYRCLPLPRMRSTYLRGESGTTAGKDDIIKSVKKGIYAEQFTNGQVNIGPGDFTFYMKSGWLIEDGRLTRPVKDVNIIGNGPKVLSEIEMVGDDLWIPPWMGMCGKNGQGVPVSDGLPTLKIRSITVGGRS